MSGMAQQAIEAASQCNDRVASLLAGCQPPLESLQVNVIADFDYNHLFAVGADCQGLLCKLGSLALEVGTAVVEAGEDAVCVFPHHRGKGVGTATASEWAPSGAVASSSSSSPIEDKMKELEEARAEQQEA